MLAAFVFSTAAFAKKHLPNDLLLQNKTSPNPSNTVAKPVLNCLVDSIVYTPSSYDVLVYDAYGNPISIRSVTATSDDLFRATYTYNAHGHILTQLAENWDGTAWVNYAKGTITYDASENMINNLQENWNGTAWENSILTTYTYDGSGNITTELEQDWDGTAWADSYKYAYTYDANKNMLTNLIQGWSGSWINNSLATYTYDANNNQITETDQAWDIGLATWVNTGKYDYAYNAAGNRTTEINYIWSGGTWQSIGTTTHYYSNVPGCVPMGTAEVAKPKVSVYPNPATEVLRIQSPAAVQVSLLSMEGKVLLHQAHASAISVAALPAGVYMLRITNADGHLIQVERVVVKH
jgi:hypothetical protein